MTTFPVSFLKIGARNPLPHHVPHSVIFLDDAHRSSYAWGSMKPETLRRRRRVLPNATLRDVAKIVGVTASIVSLWERGKRTPTPENLKAWRKALARLEKENL